MSTVEVVIQDICIIAITYLILDLRAVRDVHCPLVMTDQCLVLSHQVFAN